MFLNTVTHPPMLFFIILFDSITTSLPAACILPSHFLFPAWVQSCMRESWSWEERERGNSHSRTWQSKMHFSVKWTKWGRKYRKCKAKPCFYCKNFSQEPLNSRLNLVAGDLSLAPKVPSLRTECFLQLWELLSASQDCKTIHADKKSNTFLKISGWEMVQTGVLCYLSN